MDLDEYDRHLVILLNLLQKVDLQQFVMDLKINDKDTYNRLYRLLIKEGER